jgi:hypothetical protein
MKGRKVVKHRHRTASRPKRQARKLARTPFQPEGRFTYITAGEAASYLRFDRAENPAKAFAQWAARQAVPVCKRGRLSLWLVADLDDAVRGPRDARKEIQAIQQRQLRTHRRSA